MHDVRCASIINHYSPDENVLQAADCDYQLAKAMQMEEEVVASALEPVTIAVVVASSSAAVGSCSLLDSTI